MFQHDTEIRVRYSETDKMGYLYYGSLPKILRNWPGRSDAGF